MSNHHVSLFSPFIHPDRSSIKQKTFDPVWNEEFIHEVENASTLGITVFHKAPLDDVFNANTTIAFDELLARSEPQQNDFWVDLEPSGRLRVKIDLRSSQGELERRQIDECTRTLFSLNKKSPFFTLCRVSEPSIVS